MTDIHFTDEMNPSRAAHIADFLRGPRLWIPTEQDYGHSHVSWIERTEADLTKGNKDALMATLNGSVCGVVIFRESPEKPDEAEIRNISIDPATRNRRFGSFILRNAEHAIHEMNPGVLAIEVDTKQTNRAMIDFLQSQGYAPSRVEELYDDGKPDVVLRKDIIGRLDIY